MASSRLEEWSRRLVIAASFIVVVVFVAFVGVFLFRAVDVVLVRFPAVENALVSEIQRNNAYRQAVERLVGGSPVPGPATADAKASDAKNDPGKVAK